MFIDLFIFKALGTSIYVILANSAISVLSVGNLQRLHNSDKLKRGWRMAGKILL